MVRGFKYKIGELLIFISIIFLSGHSLALVNGATFKIAFLFIGFLGCMIISRKIRITKKISSYYLFVFFLSIGMILAHSCNWNSNVWIDPAIILSEILLCYMISNRIEFSEFARKFSTLMCLFSIIAIAIYVLVNYGINIPNYTYTGLNGFNYHTIILCTWTGSYERICGPFWEPGLFATMNIYALLLEGAFSKEKPRIYVIVPLIIGILMTKSTAGYLLMVLAIYFIVFKNKRHKIWIDLLSAILISGAVIFSTNITEFLYELNPEVFWKLTESSMTTDTRLYSPLVCFLIFLKNPILGFGMNGAINMFNTYKSVFEIDALTSTNTYFLAAFGIWGISYTIFMMYSVLKHKEISMIMRSVLLLLMILLVNKEPHYLIMTTYLMIVYMNRNKFITKSLQGQKE